MKFYSGLCVLFLSTNALAGNVLIQWEIEDIPNIETTRIYYAKCDSGIDVVWSEGFMGSVWPHQSEITLPFPPGQWCFRVVHRLTNFTEVPVSNFCASEIRDRPQPPILLIAALNGESDE